MLGQIALTVVAALLAVAGTVLAAYLWEAKLRDRVIIRRITKADDQCVAPLVELYNSLFDDDGTNYSPSEIIDLINETSANASVHHVVVDNILLVAIYRKNVVGFLFCHFYPNRRKAIISYYAVDSKASDAKNSASERLLERLKDILLSVDGSCDYLFFDLQGAEASTPRREARRRKGRPVLFKQNALRFGFEAHLLQFKYVCPKVSLSEDSREYPFNLMCVPIKASLPIPTPRTLMMEFLAFIHLDCYGDLYPISDARFREYQTYLTQRLDHYSSTLPEFIEVN